MARLGVIIFVLTYVTTLALGDVLYSNLNPGATALFLPVSTGPSATDASVYAATLLFVPASIYGGSRLCNVTGISVIGTSNVSIPSYNTNITSDVGHALSVDLYETNSNSTLPSSSTKIGTWRSAYSTNPWPPTYGQVYSGWGNLSLWTSDVKYYWMVISVRLDTSGYVGLLRSVNASAVRMCNDTACFTNYTRYVDMRQTFGFTNWTYATNVYQSVYANFAPYTNTLWLETEISTDCDPPVSPPPVSPPPVTPPPVSPPVDPPVEIPIDPPVATPVEAPLGPPVEVPVPYAAPDPPVADEPPVVSEPPITPPEDSTLTSPSDVTPGDITSTPVLTIVFSTTSTVFLTLLIVFMLLFLWYRARVKRIADRSAQSKYEFSKDPEAGVAASASSSSLAVVVTPDAPPERKSSTKKMMEEPIGLSKSPPAPLTTPPPLAITLKKENAEDDPDTSGYDDPGTDSGGSAGAPTDDEEDDNEDYDSDVRNM